VTQEVGHQPSKCEVLSSSPVLPKYKKRMKEREERKKLRLLNSPKDVIKNEELS
jgi:hypothetical protein